MWSKMYYVEKCGEICHVDKCFHMTDISTWEMKNVETICFYALILHNHISLSQLTMYCYNLRCFVAKSVLLRFTRFCVEKNWTKNCACGEKKDKYQVCSWCVVGQWSLKLYATYCPLVVGEPMVSVASEASQDYTCCQKTCVSLQKNIRF